MFEAVGREYWDAYFQTLYQQLKPGGKACVQAIVIRDDLFERYANSADFIQRYVFPGGMLPSATLFERHAVAAGLRVTDRFAFGLDYAETLRRWRENIHERIGDVRALGYDRAFERTWDFYLAFCEAGFRLRALRDVQLTLSRPLNESVAF